MPLAIVKGLLVRIKLWRISVYRRSFYKDFPSLLKREMYICWFIMCRLSRKVHDSFCSVQNVLNILYTAEESCTERYGIMTNQQIFFRLNTRCTHLSCLGLICEIWMFFYLRFALIPWIFNYCSAVYKILYTAVYNISRCCVQSVLSLEK